VQWDRTLRTASEEHERAALWAGRLAAAHALRATDKKSTFATRRCLGSRLLS
jgi:hypothetical protein